MMPERAVPEQQNMAIQGDFSAVLLYQRNNY